MSLRPMFTGTYRYKYTTEQHINARQIIVKSCQEIMSCGNVKKANAKPNADNSYTKE